MPILWVWHRISLFIISFSFTFSKIVYLLVFFWEMELYELSGLVFCPLFYWIDYFLMIFRNSLYILVYKLVIYQLSLLLLFSSTVACHFILLITTLLFYYIQFNSVYFVYRFFFYALLMKFLKDFLLWLFLNL